MLLVLTTAQQPLSHAQQLLSRPSWMRSEQILRSPEAAIPRGGTLRQSLTTACQQLANACQLLACLPAASRGTYHATASRATSRWTRVSSGFFPCFWNYTSLCLPILSDQRRSFPAPTGRCRCSARPLCLKTLLFQTY